MHLFIGQFDRRCVMGIEYIAAIKAEHYEIFRMIVTTPLPRDYGMWLRVRDRGKLRALTEHGTIFSEVEISPIEFGNYCKEQKRPDFSIVALDRCAAAIARTSGGVQIRKAG
jgi:hypothetical protein